MNTTRNHQRLDELARNIATLDEAVVHTERASLELFGDEHQQALASSRVTEAKAALDKALRAYFIEAEFIRRGARAPKAA